MKLKRKVLSTVMALALAMTALWTPVTAEAAGFTPVYVTDENGTTCTGDFDSLLSGQIIFYPADLPTGNDTYPVIAWANGTMCAPGLYYELLSQIAAGGYIVVTNTNMMSADGTAQIGSIDYIIAQNTNPDSIFYGKVDTENIGVAGHSQGGRSSVNAAVADSRIDCVLSIAGSNYKSEAKQLSTPTLFTTGSLDSIVMPALWVKPAYQACTGTAVYASLKNGVHTSCVLNPDKYANYAIKWFDAFLKNDASAKKVFQPGGAFSKDSNWGKYASKNW